LATAYADRSPILCITSSPPLRDTENNSLQGSIDQVLAAQPITKFAHRVITAEECPRIVSHALRVAQAGPPGEHQYHAWTRWPSLIIPPGPVLLDFPIDVLFSPVHPNLVAWGSIASPPSFPPGPHVAAVEEAIKLLSIAQRPVIITGTGARHPHVRFNLRHSRSSIMLIDP
jgi:thiamine pyrophosphate-dependent acetolactate synthase large subunit-like protein